MSFERIDTRLLKRVPATSRTQLLRLDTAQWKRVVNAWSEQYVSLLDTLLEVKEGPEAQHLLRDRGRLLSAVQKQALPASADPSSTPGENDTG